MKLKPLHHPGRKQLYHVCCTAPAADKRQIVHCHVFS